MFNPRQIMFLAAAAAQLPAQPATTNALLHNALVTTTAARPANFARQHGALRVEGTQLVNQKGEKITLRGVSFGWHSLWQRFCNEKAMEWLARDFRCKMVRATMGIEVGERCYKKDPAFSKAKVKAVVDGAIRAVSESMYSRVA